MSESADPKDGAFVSHRQRFRPQPEDTGLIEAAHESYGEEIHSRKPLSATFSLDSSRARRRLRCRSVRISMSSRPPVSPERTPSVQESRGPLRRTAVGIPDVTTPARCRARTADYGRGTHGHAGRDTITRHETNHRKYPRPTHGNRSFRCRRTAFIATHGFGGKTLGAFAEDAFPERGIVFLLGDEHRTIDVFENVENE